MHLLAGLLLLGCLGCRQDRSPLAASGVARAQAVAPPDRFVGFDRNLYPGDARLQALHRSFAFTGYWLNLPPGEASNGWVGKRAVLRQAGFGFLVLFNGRLDRELLGAQRQGTPAATLGARDAAQAIRLARREGFPDRTIVFLDQEEGGRLLPEQAAYLFGWTEAVARSSFVPGVYLSGQPAPDGTDVTGHPLEITTAADVRDQVAARHLHPVVLWVQQDACPPAPGCTLSAPALAASGTVDAPVWQYAQSPRRPQLTKSCASTYAPDGLCYAGASPDVFVDLDVASSADPSHGR